MTILQMEKYVIEFSTIEKFLLHFISETVYIRYLSIKSAMIFSFTNRVSRRRSDIVREIF